MGHQLQLVGVTLLEDAMTEDSVRVREEQREREREGRREGRDGGRTSAWRFQHHEQGHHRHDILSRTFDLLLYEKCGEGLMQNKHFRDLEEIFYLFMLVI